MWTLLGNLLPCTWSGWWHHGLLCVMFGTYLLNIWGRERHQLHLLRGDTFCQFIFFSKKCLGPFFFWRDHKNDYSWHNKMLCRVRDMIAARAGLKKVPWDGYLKHNRPSPKHTEEKWVSSLPPLFPISCIQVCKMVSDIQTTHICRICLDETGGEMKGRQAMHLVRVLHSATL